MKGIVNGGNHGSKTGGDMWFAGHNHKVTSRNLRRLIKKFPNDAELHAVFKAELDKFNNKGEQ